MRFLILAVGVFLVGCASDAPIVTMVYPKTGAKAQCGPYGNNALRANANALREAQCIQNYKEQGYVRQ